MDCVKPLNSTTVKPSASAIKARLSALALWAVVALIPASALAVTPSIVNVGIGQSANIITLDATLMDGLNDSIIEAIDSGVPVSITYEIEFRRVHALWRDPLVTSNTITHTVQYDSLQKVYRFSSTGKNVKQKIITKDKDRYQQMMLTLKEVPVASLYKLDPSEKYYLRVKANMETDRFWFPLNYFLFFVPFNDYKTSWAQSSPLQLPEPEVAEGLQSPPASGLLPGASRVTKHVVRSFNQ
jgi:hypothetical protein